MPLRARAHTRARAHLHTQGATASALISGSEPKSAGGPTFNRSNQVPPPYDPPCMCPPGVDSDTALKASRRRERGGGGGREREGDMQALGAGHRGPPASTQRVGKGANSDLFLCLRHRLGPSLPPSTATAFGRRALPPPSAPACRPVRVSVRLLLCLSALTASLSPHPPSILTASYGPAS